MVKMLVNVMVFSQRDDRVLWVGIWFYGVETRCIWNSVVHR